MILQPERLAAFGIGVDEVVRALRKTNENTSAGYLLEGGQQYLIQGIGRVRRPSDIGETVVAMRGSEPVLVRQSFVEVRDALASGGVAGLLPDFLEPPDGEKMFLKLRLKAPSGECVDAIAFRYLDDPDAAAVRAQQQVELVYRVSLDEWSGRRRLQLVSEWLLPLT